MLQRKAVSTALLETLDVLMGMKSLQSHRLVDGTALALQLGHRLSVDIDLFADNKNNYESIETELHEKFGNSFSKARYINGAMATGITIFLNDIKTDILDWKTKFIRTPFIDENIRMAAKEDILPLKFNTFLCQPEYARYEKKDYVDIANLMKEYSLTQMVELYKEKYPKELMTDRLMIEGLLLSELADKKAMPAMLNGEGWEETKKQIQQSISVFLKQNLKTDIEE